MRCGGEVSVKFHTIPEDKRSCCCCCRLFLLLLSSFVSFFFSALHLFPDGAGKHKYQVWRLKCKEVEVSLACREMQDGRAAAPSEKRQSGRFLRVWRLCADQEDLLLLAKSQRKGSQFVLETNCARRKSEVVTAFISNCCRYNNKQNIVRTIQQSKRIQRQTLEPCWAQAASSPVSKSKWTNHKNKT